MDMTGVSQVLKSYENRVNTPGGILLNKDSLAVELRVLRSA
jgi:hypothetical protein